MGYVRKIQILGEKVSVMVNRPLHPTAFGVG